MESVQKGICKISICFSLFLLNAGFGLAQMDSTGQKIKLYPEIYRIKTKVEIPVTVVAAGFTVYNFSQISKKEAPTEAQVQALNKDNINWFDRLSVHTYSKNVDQLSYIPFYVAIPLPLLCLADKRMRKDALQLGFLYLEAMTVTGVLYSTANHYTNRYRPLTYSPESPADKVYNGTAKKSFFAGHVALVATASFFTAKIYADYHPDSKLKWVFYAGAGALTAATGYMRNYAGMHFLTDVIVGATTGALSGILVPQFHKIKPGKSSHLTILPFGGSLAGFTAIYKI